MEYHIIVNPKSGSSSAPQFVEDNVVPLLDSIAGVTYNIHTTQSPGDAGRIGRMIKLEHSPPYRVIIAGGDGTAHEMMEGVFGDGGDVGKWFLAVLPLGTANALYSSLFPPGSPPVLVPEMFREFLPADPTIHQNLASLLLALDDSRPVKLSITLTRMHPSPESPLSEPSAPIPSHIVLSTSLHATILHDSEALRESTPGLERFKMAAAQNISVFFQANVALTPPRGGNVQQYDPSSGQWVAPFTGTAGEQGWGTHQLQGPFAYFLSATTTGRLEPTFVIVPTLESPGEDTMDIVVVRPMRDPRVKADINSGGDGTSVWPPRMMEVFQAAYDSGKHVNLVYDGSGASQPAKAGQQDVVVETFRCGGFRWTPTATTAAAAAGTDKSQLVCGDGSIYTVPPGGTAEAAVMAQTEHGFWVWG